MNLSGRLREMLRDLAVAAARFDPLMDRTFSQASLIACTTSETMRRIPPRYRDKCLVLPAIGIAIPEAFSPPEPAPSPTFLFAGRLLYWKGLHLALRAMPEVLRHAPNARLKIVGEGRDARWLKRVAEECGVAGSVDWIPRIEHREMAALYRGHAAIVFPSLHDSGGMVVLESLAAQVPVICLALGGPGMFVDSLCGISIDPAGQTEEEIQHALASAMIQLAQQPAMRNALAAHCLGRALQFTWRGSADHFYTAWETIRAPRKVPARA
jgi:glycosyltransferase involved in cell wall biosynthesis